ncbi:MAG: signal peptidase II [Gemmatimonadota bacterium]
MLVLDQLTKAWAASALWDPPRSLEPIDGWLHLTPVENRGIAFGLFAEHALVLLAGVLVLLVLLALKGWRDFLGASIAVRTLVGLVAVGAVGNLIDRARYGYVLDFVTLPKLPFFQVFNVADSAITVGGALLAIVLLRGERSDHVRG